MKVPRVTVEGREYTAQGLLNYMGRHRRLIARTLAAVGCVVVVGWFIGLGTAPSRQAGDPVALDRYGVPETEITIVYPPRLGVEANGDKVTTLTVLARALSQEAVRPLLLLFPLSDEAIAFVDAQGGHIPGRLEVVPGYPDAMPYDLRVVHGDTQIQARILRPYRVVLVPRIGVDSGAVAVPELAFEIRLEGRVERALRRLSASICNVAMPCLFLGLVLPLIAWGWYRVIRSRRQGLERELASSYGTLREQIKLDRWADARKEIDYIRLLRPHYRDVDQIDTLVGAAETSKWRREELYQAGLVAYRERDWPSAVQAFGAVEREAPYYRDVRFLRRTAALYADLHSRDRSLRIAAARELGDVADLIDMIPLIEALGDRSPEVADAVETSFRCLGIAAFDVLLKGIKHESSAVRQRAYRLIEGYGQSAHEQLTKALHSTDPRIVEPVAMLLVTLGAREELAKALLWAEPEHHETIIKAMISEGIAACNPLIQALLDAPVGRQQVIINALAALKLDVRIDHRLEEVLRQTKDPAKKDLLRRALGTEPTSFQMNRGAPSAKPLPTKPEEKQAPGKTPKARRRHLFDRRRS